MMKKVIIGVLSLAAVLLVCSSVVVTGEDEYKLIRRFGKVDRVITEAGVSVKVPILESVDTVPKKMLLYDLAQSDVITQDKKTMIADSFVIWEISEPLKFAQTLNSSLSNAESRIDAAVFNATKNVISSMTQTEVIASRDGELQEAIMNVIGNSMDSYGIKLLSVETKQLDLPADNKEAVYERMISERDKIAATYIAEGDSEAKKIRNTTDKEVSIMISDAEAQAAGIIAEGEAEYMRILAEAYADEGRADFYGYVRALDAAKNSLTGENNTLILPKNSPIADIFMVE